ncbi:hypothetical protein ACIRJM_19495 [Streptomyces sp. NPDC102405]|uniref:hypothetical protein n=1 Tax=Streptomyces sp. NPDC102405 TaxID=3366170 RepID=UPI0037FB0554
MTKDQRPSWLNLESIPHVAFGMTIALLYRAGEERTGSYGAAPEWFLSRERMQVVEVDQPDRRAAVAPKTGEGPAADLRALRPAKESAVKAR